MAVSLRLRVFFLCVLLGDIGEHECATALVRLEVLRARLLKQRLRLRPRRALVYTRCWFTVQCGLLLHGVLGLESLQLLCSGAHDIVRRRDKLLLSGVSLVMHKGIRTCMNSLWVV